MKLGKKELREKLLKSYTDKELSELLKLSRETTNSFQREKERRNPRKPILGKNQTAIFTLLAFAISFYYLANKQLNIGGGFSEGIYAGFFLGLTFVCSVTILFLWLRMLYLNFKVRVKKDEIK